MTAAALDDSTLFSSWDPVPQQLLMTSLFGSWKGLEDEAAPQVHPTAVAVMSHFGSWKGLEDEAAPQVHPDLIAF